MSRAPSAGAQNRFLFGAGPLAKQACAALREEGTVCPVRSGLAYAGYNDLLICRRVPLAVLCVGLELIFGCNAASLWIARACIQLPYVSSPGTAAPVSRTHKSQAPSTSPLLPACIFDSWYPPFPFHDPDFCSCRMLSFAS